MDWNAILFVLFCVVALLVTVLIIIGYNILNEVIDDSVINKNLKEIDEANSGKKDK